MNTTKPGFLGRAVIAAQQAGYDPIPSSLYNTLANLEFESGNKEQGEAYLRQALDSLAANPNKRFEASILNNLGKVFRDRGDWPEARPLLDRSQELRIEVEDRRGQIFSLLELGSLNNDEGRLSDAIENLLTVVELCRELGRVNEQLTAFQRLAALHWELGDNMAGQAAWDAGMALAVENDRERSVLAYESARIMFNSSDDTETRLAQINAIEAKLAKGPESGFLMGIRLDQARLLKDLGETAPALELLHAVAAWAQENDDLDLERDASLELVTILLDSGEHDEAATLLGDLTASWPYHSGTARQRARLAELLVM